MGLKINEIKTKYVINTRNKVRFRNVGNLKFVNYTFQSVREFKCLVVLATKNSEVKSE
jgi:hypothetical protein